MKSGPEYAQELVGKAENDLAIASIGIEHGAPLDTVCFHLQQTAEKLLKGLLNSKNVRYPLTHDLGGLLELALPHFPELFAFVDRFEEFASYAVEMRYSTVVCPSEAEALSAFEAVKEFRALVYRLLPSGVRPQIR